jgi:hypothetical protein
LLLLILESFRCILLLNILFYLFVLLRHI